MSRTKALSDLENQFAELVDSLVANEQVFGPKEASDHYV